MGNHARVTVLCAVAALAVAVSTPASTAAARLAPPAPNVVVLPATALYDRQTAAIRGVGLPPNQYVTVAQCAGRHLLTPCVVSSTSSNPTRTDATGALHASAFLRRTLIVGAVSQDCAITTCYLIVKTQGFKQVTPLVFDRGAAPVQTGLPPQQPCVAWPTKGWATGSIPAGVDPAAVAREGNQMIADGATSVVVIYGGKVVYENYASGHGPDVIEPSFSMSKSFASTVVGLLVQQGKLALDARAPIAEWSQPFDPRNAITLRNILNMSSGLQWNEIYADIPGSDVMQMILREPDQAGYVIAKPLAHTPGTVSNYSTGDTAILGRIIANTANVSGPSYEQYLHDVLFDPLGMNPAVPAFDETGTWDAGWFTNMSTRNFAKLGYLYLRNGVWEDQQLLSPNWVDFVRTPSPASAGYGGQFWLDPDGSFRMIGLFGQTVHIVPASDLIVAWSSGYGSGRMESLFRNAQHPSCGAATPALRDDTAEASAGHAVSIGVLNNDSGGNTRLAPGTLTVSQLPMGGSATIYNGRVVYKPVSGFRGTDRFSYFVCTRSRTTCLEASVTVAVT